MVSIYPACFYKEKNSGYSVIFPVLNIATCGDTLEEAQRMAVDCLAGFLDEAQQENRQVPPPPAMGDIDIDGEYDGYESAFTDTVAVDAGEYAREHFR